MPPKYRPGQTDGNGREYLFTDQEVVSHTSYYATDWPIDPTGDTDFYGAARDGYYYIAGVATGTPNDGCNFEDAYCWGSTVESGNDYSLKHHTGISTSGSTVSISGDTITFTNPSRGYTLLQLEDNWVTSAKRWWFPGGQDIDIQVDYSNFTTAGGGYYGFSLILYYNEKNWIGATFSDLSGTRTIRGQGRRLDALVPVGSESYYAGTSGKIRITKEAGTGTTATYKVYYWNGSSFTEVSGFSADNMAEGLNYQTPFNVVLAAYSQAGGYGNIDVSNFIINDGTPSTRAGWTYEIDDNGQFQAGDNFPEKAIIYSTNNSSQTTNTTYDSYFTIVDAETENIWLQYSDRMALYFYGAGSYETAGNATHLNVTAKGGKIRLSSFHQYLVYTASDGTCYNFSFINDIIHAQTYNNGYIYQSHNTWGIIDLVPGGSFYSHAYALGFDSTNYRKNQEQASTTSYNDGPKYSLKPWQTLPTDGDTDGSYYRSAPMGKISTAEDDGYYYLATATLAGSKEYVWIYRRPKYSYLPYPEATTHDVAESVLYILEYSSAALVGATKWQATAFDQDTRDLYISCLMSATTDYRYLYKVPYSTYNALWGTENTIQMNRQIVTISAWVGLANYYKSTHWGQENSLIAYDGNMYYCDDVGIYTSTDGSSQTLLYGETGSGASYEILGSYDRISCINLQISFTVPYIIGCYTSGTDYYYFAINLDTNELVTEQDITSDMTTEPMEISAYEDGE